MSPAFGADGDLLVAAAWLHDIGYAPELGGTGFHPLDGARFVAGFGAVRLAGLVAHHSCAAREAELRGLAAELAEFDDERSPVRDALWTCDMTTGPDGRLVTFDERLAEIIRRYGPSHRLLSGVLRQSLRTERAPTAARMSRLVSGDESLHYSDNSHRWICPHEGDAEEWSVRVRQHMEAHRTESSNGSRARPAGPTASAARDGRR